MSQSDLDAYLGVREEEPAICPRPLHSVAPLSYGQEQIWLHGLLDPDLPLYNETVAIRHKGVLDFNAFDKSLRDVIHRHEIWRTSVRLLDGIPYQFIHADLAPVISQVDLSRLPTASRQQEAYLLAARSARELFNLADGSLLRILIVKLDDLSYVIYLTLHHLIFDGVSLRQILFPELAALYSAYRDDIMRPTVAAPALQYADFATWQRSIAVEAQATSVAYWKAQLADVECVELPADRVRTMQTRHYGDVHRFKFNAALTSAMNRFSFQERATLFNIMASSLVMLLGRYSESEDVVLGTIVAERSHPKVATVPGYFLNTLALRVDLSGNPNFIELVERVREVTLSALSHADVPFQRIVRGLVGNRNMQNELLNVVLALQPRMEKLAPEWDLDFFDVPNGTAKFDVHIELEEQVNEIIGRAIYNTELFDATTIERLIQHWANLLEAALAAPSQPVWKLSMLSEAEHRWLTKDLNETQKSFPDLCMPELFARQASLAPLALAVSCDGHGLTYRDLDQKSTQLANYLISRGFGQNSVIAFMLSRGPDILIALIGILKAGGCYVPIDPRYPAARIALMLRACSATLLVTHLSVQSNLPTDHPALLRLDEDDGSISCHPTSLALAPRLNLSSAAYIIFTSGSTGAPKGVEISHRALANLLWSMKTTPGLGSEDVLLAVTSISFDIAALELLLPLISGARVEIALDEETSNPAALRERIKRSGATIMQATPATWRMLVDCGWSGDCSLTILCGGEALPQKLATQLLSRSKAVWNMYGPTETTVWSACCQVQNIGKDIPIGEPIANTSLYVLDAHQLPAPIGVIGELYIGGDGLATGYWNNEQESAVKFPLITCNGDAPRRLYRTGDRVIRRTDGSLAFIGRTDTQIKLHGFRIELGEIENVLRRLPGVRNSIVVKLSHYHRGDVLAAYLVPDSDTGLDLSALREELKSILPAHMRPSIFYALDSMPLTPNGKLDRSRLPDPFEDNQGAEHEAPREGTEQTLAPIWCTLLRIKHVGRHDDFFDLGGHSLLGAQLLAHIKSHVGLQLSLSTLIQAPTIALLARVLEGGALPCATLLKNGSSPHKHLFWIGAAPWLRRLAGYLRADQTLLTITIDPDSLSRFAPDYKLENMAAYLRARIRDIKPDGPYLIAGFCKEAVLAYEVGQQLRLEGCDVPLLVLGDTFRPGRMRTSLADLKVRLHRELLYLARIVQSPSLARAFFKGRKGAVKHVLHRRKWRKQGISTAAQAEPPQNLLEALFMAEMQYVIKPYGEPVLFLEAGGTGSLPHWSTSRSWNALLKQPQLLVYPGEHLELHGGVCLSLAGSTIADAIDQAVPDALS